MLLGAAQAHAEETPPASRSHLELELLTAPAWDSNAAQEDVAAEAPDADGLGVFLGHAELRGALAPRLWYVSTLEAGAKRFVHEHDEDSLILQFSTQLSGALPAPWSLLASVDAKDRHQPGDRRSYRSGDASAGLGLGLPGGFDLGLQATGIAFQYLPDADYDHTGWGGALSLRWAHGRFEAESTARWLVLGYEGVRVADEGQLDPGGEQRRDQLGRIDLTLRQIGTVVAEESGYLQATGSNSAGSTNRRLGANGSLSVALPWSCDLSLRAALLWARYEKTTVPPDLADPTFGVEDEETRSSLGIALRRPLYGPLSVEGQYSRYFTLGQGPTYRRDVFLLGLRMAGEL